MCSTPYVYCQGSSSSTTSPFQRWNALVYASCSVLGSASKSVFCAAKLRSGVANERDQARSFRTKSFGKASNVWSFLLDLCSKTSCFYVCGMKKHKWFYPLRCEHLDALPDDSTEGQSQLWLCRKPLKHSQLDRLKSGVDGGLFKG